MSFQTNKILSAVMIIAYLYLSVFSLLALSGHGHTPMSDCPYMIGHSMCSMTTFEHLDAWRALILTMPNIIYIFSLFIIVFFISRISLALSPPILRQFLYFKKNKIELVVQNLERQFSNGVLNPKPY